MRTRYDLLNHLLYQLTPVCPFQETGWRAPAEAAVGQRLVQAEKEKQVDIGGGWSVQLIPLLEQVWAG